MKLKFNPFLRSASIVASISMGCMPCLKGASATWDGDTNGNWNNSANWSAAFPNLSGDVATFNANVTNSVITLGQDITITSIKFDTANCEAYTFNAGNKFILGGGGDITVNGTVTTTQTINTLLQLGGNGGGATYNIVNNSTTGGQSLTLGSGGITGGSGGGAGAKVLAVSGAGNINLNGIISNGGATNVSLTKSGTGNLTLSAGNTYTGNTTINGGTLTLNYTTVAGKIADTSVLVLGGGTLSLANGASAHTEVVASTTLNAGASAVTRASGSSILRMNAIARNVGSSINFGAAGIADTDTSNTNGILGGWATVNGTDWATSATSAADTAITAYSGYTNDTWALGNNTTVTTSSAPVSDSTTNSLRFHAAGANTVTLAGTNTITSGGILVTSNVGNNLSTITGGTLAGASGLDLVVNQYNTSNGLTISSIIANNTSATGLTKSGAGTLTLTASANSFTGATTIGAGTLEIGGSGRLGSGTYSANIVNNSSLFYNSSANQIFQTGVISGVGSLTKGAGNSQLTLSGANTFTGGITINGGQVVIAADSGLGASTGAVTLNGGAIKGSGTIVLGSGRTITLGASGGYLSNGSNQSWTINSKLTGSGFIGYNYDSSTSNSMTLTSTTNDYSGETRIGTNGPGYYANNVAAAYLNMGATNALPFGSTAGNVVVGYEVNGTAKARLNLNGFSTNINGLSTNNAANSSVDNTAVGTVTLTLGNGDAIADYAGVITNTGGAMSIIKTGTGNQTFSGASANTYSGLTTVSAGSLLLGKSGAVNAIAGGGLTIGAANNTAATVQYTGASSDMMGAGTVTINGRGILDFNGKTDTIGNISIVSTGATTSNPTPIINTAGGGNLTIGTLGITPVAGFTSVVNSGTGTLTLGGDVSFTAATTGQAQVSGKLDLGSAARTFTLDLGSGVSHDMLVDAVVSSSAGAFGITKAGTGRLTLSNANTFTGNTMVTAGTLRLANNLAIQNSVFDTSGAGTLDTQGVTTPTFGGLTLGGNLALHSNVTSLTLKVAGTQTYSGSLSGGTALALSKSGAGTQVLGNSNNYSGATSVSEGILNVAHNSALGSNSAVAITSTITAGGVLELANGITVTGKNITISGFGTGVRGSLRAATGAAAEWAGQVVIGGSGSPTDTRVGAMGNGTLTISGAIVNGTLNTLVVSAENAASATPGKVIVSGTSNTYSGQTQVFRGILAIGANNALPTGTVLNVHAASGISDTAQFDLNGYNQQVAGLLRGNTSGPAIVTNTGGTTKTLTINNTADYTYDSAITGNLALVKDGAAKQTLSGTNTYNGATTINEGILALGAAGSIDNTSGVALGGGTFDVSAKSGGYTVNNLTGTGNVVGGLTVSTELAIGNSPGEISFGGNLTLGTISTLADFNYEFTGGDTSADLGIVGGDLTLDSKVFLNLFQLGTYTLGDTFTLFAYDNALIGTFIGLAEGDTTLDNEGNTWRINYAEISGGDNFTGSTTGLNFVNITAVPEPNVAALLGALGTLILLRRRRA